MSAQLSSLVSNPDETNGPLMSIACWCLVGISGGFLTARLCIRKSQSKLWFDDCLLVISWVSGNNFRADCCSYNAGIAPHPGYPKSTRYKSGLREARA
jgi:hypothetical protein